MTYKPEDAGTALQLELENIAAEFAAQSARIAKLEAAGVQWFCDFTRPLGEYGFSVQAKEPTRVTVGRFVAPSGKMARLETRSGDSNVAGSGAWERCDLRLSNANTDGVEGREHWWSHVVVFPFDYVHPPQSPVSGVWHAGVVFNFHNTTDGAGQANFQVNAMPVTVTSPDRPTGLNLQMAFGDQAAPTVVNYPVGPIELSIPYRFKYHVLWTSSPNGYFDAWVNDVQKMTYRGPTLYPGQGVYLKCANYHSPHGKASAVLHGRLVRGNSKESV